MSLGNHLIRFLESEYEVAEKRYHAAQRALNEARGLMWAVDSLQRRMDVVAKIKREARDEQAGSEPKG